MGLGAFALLAAPAGLSGLALAGPASAPQAGAPTPAVHGNPSLRIAVAANFRAPFEMLGAEFAQANGVAIAPVFGASGLLATQIRQGAPFDAFFSADMAKPQALVDDGLAHGPVRLYARGRVALWAPRRIAGLADLGFDRIGLPNPKLAPYGQAALECLQTLKLWERRQDGLVFGSNVAQVTHFLVSGALPAGFVALGQLVAQEAPAEQYWVCPQQAHKPIDQGAVLMRGGAGQAASFLDFMTGPGVRSRLAELGYAAAPDLGQAADG